MNIHRKISIVLSVGEVISALKARFPESLAIMAMSAKGNNVRLTVDGQTYGQAVTLEYGGQLGNKYEELKPDDEPARAA